MEFKCGSYKIHNTRITVIMKVELHILVSIVRSVRIFYPSFEPERVRNKAIFGEDRNNGAKLTEDCVDYGCSK